MKNQLNNRMVAPTKWTHKDKLLFHIIEKYGRQNENSKKVVETFRKRKNKPDVTLFGVYDKPSETFYWTNGMNEITLNMVNTHYQEVFGSNETIVKLCKPVVRLEQKYHCVIPYLMDILNAAFSVLPVQRGEQMMFGLVKLGLQDDFDFNAFDGAMGAYRLSHLRPHRKTQKRKHRD
jgi:hypothetical protein